MASVVRLGLLDLGADHNPKLISTKSAMRFTSVSNLVGVLLALAFTATVRAQGYVELCFALPPSTMKIKLSFVLSLLFH